MYRCNFNWNYSSKDIYLCESFRTGQIILGQEKENIAGGGIENPVNNTTKSRLKVTIK